jgi:hypothetical protein
MTTKRLPLLVLWLICLVGSPIVLIGLLLSILTKSPRARRTLMAYDRLGNAATGGRDTELMSSRANRGRAEGNRGWCMLCRILDWLDDDHCTRSAGK